MIDVLNALSFFEYHAKRGRMQSQIEIFQPWYYHQERQADYLQGIYIGFILTRKDSNGIYLKLHE